MDRKSLKKIAHEISDEFERLPYDHWHREDFPIVYEQCINGETVNVELELLENKDEYLHIGVGVDDGKFFNSLVPVTSSFIIYR